MIDLKPIKERNLYLIGEVTQDSISCITSAILDINESDEYVSTIAKANSLAYTPKPIKIHIETYGGDSYPCMGLIGVIEASKTPIHTIAIGAAMSCGFMVLISGHKRFCYKYATPLYHEATIGLWEKLEGAKKQIKQSSKIEKWMKKYTLERTNITKKLLKKIHKAKIDYYMDARKALHLGVVDGIIE